MVKRDDVAEEDKKVLQVDKHWFWLLRDSLHGVALVGVALLVFAVAVYTGLAAYYFLALFCGIIGSFLFYAEVYSFDKSFYECTEHDFLDHVRTLFSFQDITVHYNLVREVKVHQSMLGQVLGFADVEIDAGGGDNIKLPYVINHQQIKEFLIPRVGPPPVKPEPTVVTDGRGGLKELPTPESRNTE